jgi:putative hydrolase of the HAD superfamily
MNVVFDFGAVLFTWRPAELLAQSFPDRACDPQQAAQLAQAVFAHEDWHSFDRGTLPMGVVVERTAARLGLEAHVLADLVHSIGDRLVPIDETVALLAQLHGLRSGSAAGTNAPDRRSASDKLKLYFLSNMPVPYARTLEHRHSFLQWFDGGIFSGDVQHIKPEPAIYHLLQSRYALEPAQTLFIDDLHANVQAACGLGWSGVHFESAHQLQARLANWLDQSNRAGGVHENHQLHSGAR